MFDGCRLVLLDFDGPVADLFPRGYSGRIGDATREPLLRAGVELPEPVDRTVEHLRILRFAGVHAPELVTEMDRIAVEYEIEAARTAPLTAGVAEFLGACTAAELPVVIVSNNAAPAIHEFLRRHGLDQHVADVVGRPFGRPDLMKPNPELLAGLEAEPATCVMIGDSASDVEFSRRAGFRSIGYAKSPNHGAAVADADSVTGSMGELANAVLRTAGRP